MQTSVQGTNSPGLFGYLCALGGMLALCSLIVALSLVVHAAVQLGALGRLEGSIASGSLLESRYYLKRLTHPPKLFSWLLSKRESPAFKVKRDYQLEGLLKVLTFAQASNFSAARDALTTLNEETLLRLTGASNQAQPIVGQLRTLLESAESSQSLLRDNDIELDSLRRLEQRYRSDFENLGKQFAELLSLEAEKAHDFPVYSKGALVGLPRLRDLPDEIPSFIALKAILDQLGAEVKIEGPNPHQVFLEKIEALRTSTQSLTGDLSDVQAKIIRLKNDRGELARRAQFELANLRAGIFSTLSQATNQVIDPRFFKSLGYLPGI